MRQTLLLYINGQLADLGEASVLMNYKETDVTAPAAVLNSYSQQLTLPPTAANNKIFGHIGRNDFKTASAFNALSRTPFVLMSAATAEVLERGYLKLNSIATAGYSITLYGGLGSFLYSLMYNADGSKKTLADLNFMGGATPASEFNFRITRDAVRAAWRQVTGLETTSSLWNYINFAHCYEGLPNNFDTKKALCPDSVYGVKASDTVDGTYYQSRSNNVMVDMVNDMTGMECADLRSYLQRPVLKFEHVIGAICNPANNGGYGVDLDSAFFKNGNPYYKDTWLTLQRLDNVTVPNETGSGSAAFSSPNPGALPTYDDQSRVSVDINGPWASASFSARHTVTATIVPTLITGGSVSRLLTSWEIPQTPSGRMYMRIVALYQLIAIDGFGNVIGGSKVAAASTLTKSSDGVTPLEVTVNPAEFVSKYNNALGTHWNSFTPAWIPEDGNAYDDAMCNGEYYGVMAGSEDSALYDSEGNQKTITLTMTDISGVSRVVLRTTFLSVFCYGSAGNPYYQGTVNQVAYYDNPSSRMRFIGVRYANGQMSYTYRSQGTVHSGTPITKQILLGGTKTPADYLLAYCKQHGLYIAHDKDTGRIGIMSRGTFYNGGDQDLTGKVDKASVGVQPYVLDSRWYDFQHDSEGAFIDYYNSAYSRAYGMQRINTGYQFDANHNDVLSGIVIKGGAEVLEQGKYYVRITEQSKECPAPFIDGGQFTLWSLTGATVQRGIITPTPAASIEYINQTRYGYDYSLAPKLQLHDADRKSLDGTDILLMLNGYLTTAYYSRLCLTDDNGLMARYNEGRACWLLGQSSLAANANYCIGDNLRLPLFRRYAGNITHSLDMGVPSEIDQPSISVPASAPIYYRGWASYFADRYSVDARIMTAKVDLRGMGGISQALLRKFYYYDGAWWVMNEIKNYQIGGDGLTQCSFIKVQDKTAYTNGQSY